MITENGTRRIWILLAESFPTVVLELSWPFWFAGKLIFRVCLADRQSSCTPAPLSGSLATVSPVRSCSERGVPRASDCCANFLCSPSQNILWYRALPPSAF